MNALRDQLLATLSKAMQASGTTPDPGAVQKSLEQADLDPGLKRFLNSLVGSGSPGAAPLPTRNQVLDAIAGLAAKLGPEDRQRLDAMIDQLGQLVGAGQHSQEAIKTLKSTLEQPRR